MKIVAFTNREGQRSKEWHAWRKNGIGASDIAVIMRSNPFKTPMDLWNEKCGFKEDEPVNPAMLHGIENEPMVRDQLNRTESVTFEPFCIEDQEHAFFRASLDGYDEEKKVLVEIKCPVSKKILKDIKENKKIPPYWNHQIQWQMMLCRPDHAFIAVWDHTEKTITNIEMFPNLKIQDDMRKKGEEFWRNVKMGIPPTPEKKDYIRVNDEKLKSLLEEYDTHADVQKEALQNKNSLRDEIIKFGNGGSFLAFDHVITRCIPRETYDFELMKKDGIQVEKYLKKNVSPAAYRISLSREKYRRKWG